MQEVLDLAFRVKRVGGGYCDEPYDAEVLLQLGAEEVVALRDALETARGEAQWVHRALDEERSHLGMAQQAELSATRLEAEELRARLAEMETRLERNDFSVRVLAEKSEKAMELLAIKAEKLSDLEAALQRAEAAAEANAGGAALAQIEAGHAARSQQIADEVRAEIARAEADHTAQRNLLHQRHVASLQAEQQPGHP